MENVGGNYMRLQIILILSLLSAVACDRKTESKDKTIFNEEQNDTVNNKSIQSTMDSLIVQNDSLNFTDSLGQKQGKWQFYLKGKLWKVEYYKNNLLHGKQIEFASDGEISQTEFKNGKRNGYWLQYSPNQKTARFASLWQNGVRIWTAFPSELRKYLLADKGFLLDTDSFDIVIPYNSGSILYTGRVLKVSENRWKGKGEHRIYYENGQLLSVFNYSDSTIRVLNKQNETIANCHINQWNGEVPK